MRFSVEIKHKFTFRLKRFPFPPPSEGKSIETRLIQIGKKQKTKTKTANTSRTLIKKCNCIIIKNPPARLRSSEALSTGIFFLSLENHAFYFRHGVLWISVACIVSCTLEPYHMATTLRPKQVDCELKRDNWGVWIRTSRDHRWRETPTILSNQKGEHTLSHSCVFFSNGILFE